MKKVVRAGIIALSLAILAVGYFIYLSRMSQRTSTDSADAKQTELQQVLDLDLVRNYPETPREVIKTFNRITALFYDEELDADQIEKLCDMMRLLMDQDLAAKNPREEYIDSVRVQIKHYRESNSRLVSSKVASTSEIEKKKVGADQMAYVEATYTIRQGKAISITHQKFALRRDHDGNYRILAFTLDGEQ